MKRLVIVSGNKNGYSETFVRNHIRYLPAEVHHLYGGTKPTFAPNDEPLMLPEKWADKFFIGTNRRTKQRLNEGIKIYLKTHKIDAVLAEFGPTGVEMMSLCKVLKIPLIVHFHGFDAHNKDIVKAYKVAYKKMFKIAAALVVVSADMRRQLLRLGAPDAKVYHLTLGVDIKLFHPSNKVVTTPNFVSVGRFVPKKAPHLCLEAFAKVYRRFPEARLTMIGTGRLLNKCKQVARDLKIESAVTFTGILKPSEIVSVLQASTCFIQHSVTPESGDAEGTPISVMEAGACGLPVVASRHAGIPMIVEHGKTGLLFEEGDVETMAKYMTEIIEHPEKALEMGKQGRMVICKKFEVQKKTLLLWDIIESAI